MSDPNPVDRGDRTGRTVLWGGLAAVVVLSAFQMITLARVEREVEELKKAAAHLDRLDEIEAKVNELKDNQDITVNDIPKLEQKIDHIAMSLEARSPDGTSRPED